MSMNPPDELGLSHIRAENGQQQACMVDVSQKKVSERLAIAEAQLRFPAGLLEQILAGKGPKGPIEEVARVAGIMAAKRTGELIPMCHPLGLDHVEIDFQAQGDLLTIRSSCRCSGRTGIEMEAMTAASVAALTVYDMTKALNKGIVITRVALVEKRGGKSGLWQAQDGN
jgi:cyclic pyranopterin phosphate synthase